MKKKRKMMLILIMSIFVFAGVINTYAASASLNYRDPKSEGVMVCYNQPYTSSPKANGKTRFLNSDYPIYYRCYVKVTIYDKNGNVNKTKSVYSDPFSYNKTTQNTASVTVSATSSSKAYEVKTAHNIDQWTGNLVGDRVYRRYIATKYLTTFFD